MRKASVLALVLAGAVSLVLPLATAGADSIRIGAILAVTGPAANLGLPEARTLQMLVEDANAAGGILGQKVELVIKDSQGSVEKSVSFAKQLAEETGVLAIIGPSTSGESMALKGWAEQDEQLVISCAAAATIVQPPAKWVFKTPQMDSFAAQAIFSTMKKLGISRFGAVVSNTGFGQGGKAQLEKLAPKAGLTLAITEVYDSSATDLTAVLAKVKAQNVQAVVNWSVEPAQSLVPKNMRQMGFDVPLFQSHGFGNIAYVTAAGKAADGIIFPAGRLLVADALAASHPQKKVLAAYKKEYEARYREDVSTFGGHAFDAFLILSEAIRKAGSADKYKVREALEGLTGLVGTAGVFSFSPEDHNGLTLDSFEMLVVRNGAFALYGGN
ncbi:MAG TPA: ABC transporter substrate-binding protein [Spirochaetia bacterium]|nr:ABC transporter substrate-binding protein [Spirochaetia bacterium]